MNNEHSKKQRVIPKTSLTFYTSFEFAIKNPHIINKMFYIILFYSMSYTIAFGYSKCILILTMFLLKLNKKIRKDILERGAQLVPQIFNTIFRCRIELLSYLENVKDVIRNRKFYVEVY